MSRDCNGIRSAPRWATALMAMAVLAGCAGGVDEDRQRTPNFVPPDSDRDTGRITLDLERTRIPADGTTLVEAVAIVTDPQGQPIANTFVRFSSEFDDVTWLTAQRAEPPAELSTTANVLLPTNECGEFTNSDGRASCILRSSLTQGSTQVRAEATDIFLRATKGVEFTFAGGGPGLSLEFLECEDDITGAELPTTRRIVVQVTQEFEAGDGTRVIPAAGVTVFVSTTAGRFSDGREQTRVVTDALGQGTLEIQFSESSSDSLAQILAATSGGLPVSCAITITDFEVPTLNIFAEPECLRRNDPDKQELSVVVEVLPVPTFNNSLVSFGSPLGAFVPNPAGVDVLSGTAETIWTVSPSESATLPLTRCEPGGDPLICTIISGFATVTGVVDFGGAIPVQIEQVVPIVEYPEECPILIEEDPGGPAPAGPTQIQLPVVPEEPPAEGGGDEPAPIE